MKSEHYPVFAPPQKFCPKDLNAPVAGNFGSVKIKLLIGYTEQITTALNL